MQELGTCPSWTQTQTVASPAFDCLSAMVKLLQAASSANVPFCPPSTRDRPTIPCPASHTRKSAQAAQRAARSEAPLRPTSIMARAAQARTPCRRRPRRQPRSHAAIADAAAGRSDSDVAASLRPTGRHASSSASAVGLLLVSRRSAMPRDVDLRLGGCAVACWRVIDHCVQDAPCGVTMRTCSVSHKPTLQ